jgi:hypothetical protein
VLLLKNKTNEKNTPIVCYKTPMDDEEPKPSSLKKVIYAQKLQCEIKIDRLRFILMIITVLSCILSVSIMSGIHKHNESGCKQYESTLPRNGDFTSICRYHPGNHYGDCLLKNPCFCINTKILNSTKTETSITTIQNIQELCLSYPDHFESFDPELGDISLIIPVAFFCLLLISEVYHCIYFKKCSLFTSMMAKEDALLNKIC